MRIFLLFTGLLLAFTACEKTDYTAELVPDDTAVITADKKGVPPIEIEDLNIGYCSYFLSGDVTFCQGPAGDVVELWSISCDGTPTFLATATQVNDDDHTYYRFSRKTTKVPLGLVEIGIVYGNVGGNLCALGECCERGTTCDWRWKALIKECTVDDGPDGPVGAGAY